MAIAGALVLVHDLDSRPQALRQGTRNRRLDRPGRCRLEKHNRELEAIGVKRPKTTPIFYRVAASLLTSGDAIEVLGDQSSGEAECDVYSVDGGLFVGVGSDYTDRKAEAVGVSLSKEMCAKPVSREVWRRDDVAGHWAKLVLRSYASVGGERRLYQEGSVKAMLPPTELFRLYGGGGLAAGTAMFCGTLAVHGTIAPSDLFAMELEDPVLGRKITHSYRIRTLPDRDKEAAMGFHKGHKEFHKLDLNEGWEKLPGYPDGIQQKIIAGALDEKGKRGNRTRLLRFAPGVYTTKPFVHDYWEEVFLVSGDLIVGNDGQGRRGEKFQGYTYAVRPPGASHGPFKSEGGCMLLETHFYEEA